MYNGTAYFELQHNSIIGSYHIGSENVAISVAWMAAFGLGFGKSGIPIYDENYELLKNIEPPKYIDELEKDKDA